MTRRLVVEADGGSRGNPGVAGYGALVRDADSGAILRELAAPLGKASNNVAEYSGLVAGLEAARDVDPGAHVEVRMDSKLVVEQMSGRWKIKHADMARLAAQARGVAADIAAVTYTWIPRAANRAADALSNAGMDGEHVDRRPAEEAAATELIGGDEATDAPRPPVRGRDTVREETHAREELVSAPASLPRRRRGPDLGPATRIVLVRHGVTEFTTAARLDGRGGADPELSPEGTRQARAAGAGVRAFLGDRPEGLRVVSSGLARGRATGQAIAAALAVACEEDPDWDEQSFGDWDGRLLSELVRAEPDAMTLLREDDEYARPGGETHRELHARVVAAFGRAVAGGGTVVVATHRKPIMVVLSHLLDMPHTRAWRLSAAPGSLTSVRVWGDGEAVVEFVNDTAHLR